MGCTDKENDGDSNNVIPEAKEGDLNLTISITDEIYPLGIETINISVELRNIASHPITILDTYRSYTAIVITSPDNQTWIADNSRFFSNITYRPLKIELKPDESVKFNLDLVSLSPSNINWNISGRFFLQGNYYDIAYSNLLEITLT